MEVDWGMLRWALNEPGLKLHWDFGQSSIGEQSLEAAPWRVSFVWNRAEELVWSLDLTREELTTCIAELTAQGLLVPGGFREALKRFPL